MNTTVTHITKRLLTFFLALSCFATIAQTNSTEKTKQQKQDEEGAALKKWFDEGDIIIEGTSVDWKSSSFKNTSGQLEPRLCQKVKINRVLKGNINLGYVNVQTLGSADCSNCEDQPIEKRIDPNYHGAGIYCSPKAAFLIRIKKTDIQNGCFINAENPNMYAAQGRAKLVYDNLDKTNDDAVLLYQMLQKYCNVKVDLKEIQLLQDKRLATKDSTEVAEMIQNYKPTPQEKEKIKRDNAKADSIRQAHRRNMNDTTLLKKKIKVKTNSNRTSSATGCTELFISEQLDGQSSNNAVEIYNPTALPISLSNYKLLIYHNASYTPTTIALTGTISAFGTHVVAEQGASSSIISHANQTTNNLNFNGDVCTVLSKGNIHIDKIGEIGVANASGSWTLTPSGGTNNSDIRRKFTIGAGDTSWTTCKTEWDVFLEDSIHNFGSHANVCSVDPDLNLTLANGTVVGGNFEFDVMASSTGSNTFLDFADISFTYNPQAFGLNAVSNGNVTVTLGSAFTAAPHTNTYMNPQSTLENGLDTIGVAFITDGSQTSWNRVNITSTPIKLLHFSIVISNCNKNTNLVLYSVPNVEFVDDFTANATDDPNNFASLMNYDNVNVGSPINQTIPPCATNPQITSFVGGYDGVHSVIAGADYSQTASGESLLTINGSGFGTIKGTVYMANAVNNSPPLYVSLDTYDYITSWTDNQINILVPSVLFGADSINYPGTGYVYVKASGATDSTSSSTLGATNGIVKVPYILLNRSFSSGGVGVRKERIPFSYRKFFSSSSFNSDTSAYDFRFDLATVTNNVQPNGGFNCRALLKRTIEDWACKIPIKYRIGRDTTINNPNADGISYISFKSSLSNSNFGAETNVRVNTGCSSGHSYASEADVSFLSGVNWYYVNPTSVPNNTPNPNMQGGTFADFFTTALHEFGHASLLLHVNQTNDLMYFQIPNTMGVGPYISTDDAAGASDNLTWSKSVTLGTCPYNPFTIPASGAVTCIDPETGTGIDEIGNNNFQVSIYPNPAEDFINVTFTKQSESSNTIKLVNVIGQTVFYSNIGRNEGAQEVINLQSISKGVYLLIITDNGNSITKKIIVE